MVPLWAAEAPRWAISTIQYLICVTSSPRQPSTLRDTFISDSFSHAMARVANMRQPDWSRNGRRPLPARMFRTPQGIEGQRRLERERVCRSRTCGNIARERQEARFFCTVRVCVHRSYGANAVAEITGTVPGLQSADHAQDGRIFIPVRDCGQSLLSEDLYEIWTGPCCEYSCTRYDL